MPSSVQARIDEKHEQLGHQMELNSDARTTLAAALETALRSSRPMLVQQQRVAQRQLQQGSGQPEEGKPDEEGYVGYPEDQAEHEALEEQEAGYRGDTYEDSLTGLYPEDEGALNEEAYNVDREDGYEEYRYEEDADELAETRQLEEGSPEEVEGYDGYPEDQAEHEAFEEQEGGYLDDVREEVQDKSYPEDEIPSEEGAYDGDREDGEEEYRYDEEADDYQQVQEVPLIEVEAGREKALAEVGREAAQPLGKLEQEDEAAAGDWGAGSGDQADYDAADHFLPVIKVGGAHAETADSLYDEQHEEEPAGATSSAASPSSAAAAAAVHAGSPDPGHKEQAVLEPFNPASSPELSPQPSPQHAPEPDPSPWHEPSLSPSPLSSPTLSLNYPPPPSPNPIAESPPMPASRAVPQLGQDQQDSNILLDIFHSKHSMHVHDNAPSHIHMSLVYIIPTLLVIMLLLCVLTRGRKVFGNMRRRARERSAAMLGGQRPSHGELVLPLTDRHDHTS